ncbi:MAG: nucleotidyl transferase AbiEii/AbiGii toxin family protein [bacterium]|nr:nucleotidyl transferase AbiEii/AbiGii toxin family protein [bacterium]
MHDRPVPDYGGQVMAVNRVEELLRRVAKALESASVPYAVIGGNAVAAWVASVDEGAVRATKDVDLLIRRSDLAAVSDAFRPLDLTHVEVHGVSMFLDRRRPNPKTGVHLVFAGELVRPHETHAPPDPAGAVPGAGGYQVVDLPALVSMKLQAYRDVDRVHIRDLLSVGLIDPELVQSLPPDLRSRLDDIQQAPGR